MSSARPRPRLRGTSPPSTRSPTARRPPLPDPTAAPAAEPESREILGKRTQEIHNADVELNKGSASREDPDHGEGSDHSCRQRLCHHRRPHRDHADRTGHEPSTRRRTTATRKDFAEFNTEIIKANNLALPKLPEYQDYGYDEKEHKLIVLEYPDRK